MPFSAVLLTELLTLVLTPGARPSNLLLRAEMLSLRAECSKSGLCGVASATPPRRFPALPLSRRPPRARDGHYSDGLPSGAPAPPRRILAVLEEIDRIPARPLWPGFEARKVPIEIFDGEHTWLVGHPSPPEEFHPCSGERNVRVFEGRHASLRANTSVILAGVATATASLEGRSEGPRRLAGLLVHETFHVFQARRHPKWGGNEVEQLVYPSEDTEVLAQRRLESTALRRALAAGNRRTAGAWAARALAARQERFARLTDPSAAYERGTEMKEGLARYVEAKVAGDGNSLLPEAEFPPDGVRLRAYDSGAAIGLLLDRLDPAWKRRLEEKDDTPLDELLREAVAGREPMPFSASEKEAARRRAAEDIRAMGARHAALLRDFLEARGWIVVVEAGDPIFPQGFDPWNIERLSASEVLHTRWIQLGNSSGSLEVLDRHCLTEGAGKHPLFEGVARATITGLPSEPRIEETPQSVKISAEGLTLEFRAARVAQDGQTVTITVRPQRGVPRADPSLRSG